LGILHKPDANHQYGGPNWVKAGMQKLAELGLGQEKHEVESLVQKNKKGHARARIPLTTTANNEETAMDLLRRRVRSFPCPSQVWRDFKADQIGKQFLDIEVWHLHVSRETKVACGEWIGLHEAVWELAARDNLGLMSHIFTQAIQCPERPKKIEVIPRHDLHPETKEIKRRARVLITCEESMTVSRMLSRTGLVDVLTVDLLPAEYPGLKHIVADATDLLHLGWTASLNFPPCTYLSLASALHLRRPGRQDRVLLGAAFFKELWDADIPLIMIENPKHHPAARAAVGVYPTQTVHPHQFGLCHTKPTQLFLTPKPST